jgi:hypothetical protein
MIEFFFPSFRTKTSKKAPIPSSTMEQVFDGDNPITGYLISRAYFDEFKSLWKSDFVKSREHYKRHNLKLFGDCGAFSYVDEKVPPISVEDVIDFYNQIGVNYGASLDHVVPDYDAGYDYFFSGLSSPQDYKDRQEITIENGSKFLKECKAQDVDFLPIGSIQGWSPNSYKECILAFKKMGYKKIAIGGIAVLKRPDLKEVLATIKEVIGDTEIHLFGITQPKLIKDANLPNVTSVDGMGPYFGSIIRGEYFVDSIIRPKCIPVDDMTKASQIGEILKSGNRLDIEKICDPNTNFDLRRVLKFLKTDYWDSCTCKVCETLSWKMSLHHNDISPLRGYHNMWVIANEFKQIESIKK